MKDKTYRGTPIGQDVGRYMRALRWQDASPHTLAAYEATLAKLAVRFSDLTLADLAPPAGVDLVRDFLDAEWGSAKPATRRARLAAVRSFFRWAVSEGRMAADPTATLKAPRERSEERQAHAVDVVHQLVVAQPTLRDQIGLMLLGRLGLRRDELRTLRIQDIDLARDTVRIQGKGGKVVILPLVFAELRSALVLHIAAEERRPHEYLVYPKQDRSRPMSSAAIDKWFKRALATAGLPQTFQMHEMRHSAGDALYRATGDIVLAQSLLRHADVSTTRRYLHPNRDDLAAALRGLDVAWGEVSTSRVSGSGSGSGTSSAT